MQIVFNGSASEIRSIWMTLCSCMIEQLHKWLIDTQLRKGLFSKIWGNMITLQLQPRGCAMTNFRALVLYGHERLHEHFWFNKRNSFAALYQCYPVLSYKTNGIHHSVHYWVMDEHKKFSVHERGVRVAPGDSRARPLPSSYHLLRK